MPAPRYITSDSQMIAPGVYVKENAPAVPIRGQRNRVVGFVGQCVRGPVGKAVICTSYKRFLAVFGDRDKNTRGGAVIGHVWKALQGKRWGRMVIVRAAAAAAIKASFTLESAAGGAGTAILRVDAANVGTWGNDVGIKVSAATNGDANYFNLSVRLYGVVTTYQNLTTQATGQDNTNSVIGNDDATLIRVTKLADGRPVNNAPSTDGADVDGYVKLGQTVAAYTSVAGTDGSIADTDYTAADGPIDVLNGSVGVHCCAVVGRSNTVIKTSVATYAANAVQRVWYVCPDSETTTLSSAGTERATFNNGRLSYWFNHEYIIDPLTKEEIVQEPFVLPMSIMSQTDPDIHVGDIDNVAYSKASRRVYSEMDATDRDTATTSGLSFLLHDQDQNSNDVIIPGNAVTCDFADNNRELDGRYMKDFILDALAQRLRGDQFKGNTPSNRAQRAAACSSFLSDLARKERYVLKNEKGVAQFQYVNDSSVNVSADQANGNQQELCIVQLIPKNIRILLNATIGTNATITEQ